MEEKRYIRKEKKKEYVLSLSYGKDSMACLGAIEEMGLPLDRIIHAEVWATEDIPADLPVMVEFKKYADKVIKERWGIEVEHYSLHKYRGVEKEKVTYEDVFMRTIDVGNRKGEITGFPFVNGSWCNGLKTEALKDISKSDADTTRFVYVGIASDEPDRLEGLRNRAQISPLEIIGWTEADAKKWCIENDLLSPLYEVRERGGCWFCHNQGADELRSLRRDYPDLWKILLKWDSVSPIPYHANGKTVKDYDNRFYLEDIGVLNMDVPFRWKYVDNNIEVIFLKELAEKNLRRKREQRNDIQ